MPQSLTRRQKVSITPSNIFFNQDSSKLVISDNFNSCRILENAIGESTNTDQDFAKHIIINFDINENVLNFAHHLCGAQNLFYAATKNSIYEINWKSGQKIKVFDIGQLRGLGNCKILKLLDEFVLLDNGGIFRLENQRLAGQKIDLAFDHSFSNDKEQPTPSNQLILLKMPKNFTKHFNSKKIKNFTVSKNSQSLGIISIDNETNLVKFHKFFVDEASNNDENYFKLKQIFNLHNLPDLIDIKDNFALFGFNKCEKSYCQLVHLMSGSVIKDLYGDEDVAQAQVDNTNANSEDTSMYIFEDMDMNDSSTLNPLEEEKKPVSKPTPTYTSLHTAKFTDDGLILGRTGSDNVILYDNLGNFKKSLSLNFGGFAVGFSSEDCGGDLSLAVGGFCNEVRMFHDFIFQSHSLKL